MSIPSRPWKPATQHPLLRIPIPSSFLLSPSYCAPTLLFRFPPALFPDLDALARQDLVREWELLRPDEEEVVRVLGESARGIKWDEIDVESPVGWSLARLEPGSNAQDDSRSAQSTSQTVVAKDGSTFKLSREPGMTSESGSPSTESLTVPLALERRVLLVRLKQLDPAALEPEEVYDDETLLIQLKARYLPAFSAQNDVSEAVDSSTSYLKRTWSTLLNPEAGSYLDVEIRRPEFLWECSTSGEEDKGIEAAASLDEEALSEEYGVYRVDTAHLLPSPYGHFDIESSTFHGNSSSVLRVTKPFHGEGVAPKFHLALPVGDSDVYGLVRDTTIGAMAFIALMVLFSFTRTMKRVAVAEKRAEQRAKGKTS